MLWALHGFLGQGSDWDVVRAGWPPDLPTWRCPDLFAGRPPDPSLDVFGRRFAAEVRAADDAPIVMGYSLGGRLALHALLAEPSGWRGAVIVSAHLGLANDRERTDRLAADAAWAERVRHEPWDRLLEAWNAREVFGGRRPPLARPAHAFDRAALANSLEAWSLGRQANLLPGLTTLPMPVLWIAGAEDRRFVAQGELAARHGPTVMLRVAPAAAHRVPWEAGAWFREVLEEFVRMLAASDAR